MYCYKCGKEISNDAKNCNMCGCSVNQGAETNFSSKQQQEFDVVEDIQKKLKEIDNRSKPQSQKHYPKQVEDVKLAFESMKKNIREEAASSGLRVFVDDFEEKKLNDKKNLITHYPLPTSPKALLSFAKYIALEIKAKMKKPDSLTPVWNEKLLRVYQYAKAELRFTEEFVEIRQCYKEIKRKERHMAVQGLVWVLVFPIIGFFITALVWHEPLLLFASILAAGWEVFLILYVYDLLDKMIASVKQHCAKQNKYPKILRVAAWYVLIPFIAALITSIVYTSVVFISIFAVLSLVDVCFLADLVE